MYIKDQARFKNVLNFSQKNEKFLFQELATIPSVNKGGREGVKGNWQSRQIIVHRFAFIYPFILFSTNRLPCCCGASGKRNSAVLCFSVASTGFIDAETADLELLLVEIFFGALENRNLSLHLKGKKTAKEKKLQKRTKRNLINLKNR